MVNYLSVYAEIKKLTKFVNFFAINCHSAGRLNLEQLIRIIRKNNHENTKE